MYRILKRGPGLFTNEELRKRGYPRAVEKGSGTDCQNGPAGALHNRYPTPFRQSASDAIHAVFDVAPETFYSGWKWDYANLPGRRTGRRSAEPFAVRLVDVLAIHEHATE